MNCARQMRTRTTHGLVAVRRTAGLLPCTRRKLSISAAKLSEICAQCKFALSAGKALDWRHGHRTAGAEEAGDARGADPDGTRALRRARLRRDDPRGDRGSSGRLDAHDLRVLPEQGGHPL